MEKPKTVVLAVNLLWASLFVGMVGLVLSGVKTSSQTGPVFLATVFIITLVISSFLILLISDGKNWARITLGVLFAMGIPKCVGFLVGNEFMQDPMDNSADLIQTALQGYATYLIFTPPGKSWFRKHHK
jgi:hypothetical protein